MRTNLQEYKVLVVEDDSPLRNALMDKFTDEGFSVLMAKDGQQGLDLAIQQHPNIVLLDLVMPKMDGIEFMEHLRKDEWGRKSRVIILSNLNDREKLAEAMSHDVFDYLVKSDWKLEDVVRKVKDKLEIF